MQHRTTRAVRFAGRLYGDNAPIPHPDDLPGAAALFDKARQELLDMGAIVVDADTVESLADRRDDLLRQLAEASGVPADRLMVLAHPGEPGDYLLTFGGVGGPSLRPFAEVDPLAGADDAARRRHHLDALRDLDDLTYLALADDVAATLGELASFTVDPDTGIVVAVAPRPAAPIAVEGTEMADASAAGTGDAVQFADAADADGRELPPVMSAPNSEQATEAPATKPRGGRKPKAEAE